MLIDFSNNPPLVLNLIYECQECGQIKKSFDLNSLPEVKLSTASEGESRETGIQAEKIAIPIEREPQINR